MPEDNKSVNTPDTPWQDLQFNFEGAWLPDIDSALIGPENYQKLENTRYVEKGLESISGYTKINSNEIDDDVGTYVKILTGHQLRATHSQDSYILAQAASDAGQGRVYQNRIAPGSAGQFDTTSKLDTSGNVYFQDANTGLQGRFSDAPQGNIAYCNGDESVIFGGDEQRVAAAFSLSETLGSEEIVVAVDQDFSGANNWADNSLTSFDSTTNERLTITADGSTSPQYCVLTQPNIPTIAGTKYRLTFDYTTTSGSYGWFIGEITSNQVIGIAQATGSYVLEYTAKSNGGLTISAVAAEALGGYFDNFSLKSLAIADQEDVSNKVSNLLHADSNDMFTIDASGNDIAYFFTTRPIQGFYIYVDSGNLNASASSLTVKTWIGSGGWSDDLLDTDGTKPAAASLAQSGEITLTAHTDGTSKPKHFEELYLYAYAIQLSAGDADIYHITVDPAMQSIKDVWDGVYRQPIQFQVLNTNYFDYTLQVQESSDLNAPVGAYMGGLTSSEKFYIMFEDKVSAIRFTMLGDLVNHVASLFTMKYWNGTAFSSAIITDGTLVDGTKSLGQTGLVSWEPESDEEPRTLFGSFGYVYEFSISGTLTGTGAGTDPEDVVVDICAGIPAQLTVPGFAWSTMYSSRLMLCAYTNGDEGNRMDYSVANAPDVWNGFDSSDNGKQSLYYGGVEPIVAGTQIYNRFGANVYSMLLVLKHNEVYILVGDTPEEFTIYPVAKTIGCVAPLSLATAEIGMDLGGGLTRNVAIWISHSGPMMFDGAVLVPVRGVDSFFDPLDSRYVNFSLMSKAVGWVDDNYKEYNMCIPSGSGATENNRWLVYSLSKRKWFEKVPPSGHYPQCGFDVISPSTGQRYNYAGKEDGYMVQLEDGTVWDDGSSTAITQSITTGDFTPSNSIWNEANIRKFKLLTKKVDEVASTTNTATIKHYTDTSTTPYTVGTVDLSNAKETQKLVRTVANMNKTGVFHAFNFSISTTNVDKGLQPISWGVQYKQEHKDNTATT